VKVPSFLATLRERDIHVWAEGDRLRCSAPAGALTPELRDELRDCKKDILEFLCSAETLARQQRAIVPLQPLGGRVPVFGVAGHNGDVFCYRALAQHLGDDQPFYGLQPPGLDGHSPLISRVEDLAAYFAAQIRAFRSSDPCIIAGFCSGGAVAFELALQLVRERAQVNFLALFGCPYPASYRLVPQLRQRIGQNFSHVVEHARELAMLPSRQRGAYIAQKLRNLKLQRAVERPTAAHWVLALRAKVERATIVAARRYKPAQFKGCVSLFLPCSDWARSGFEALRWRSVAEYSEAYAGPDGCNADNMLREPYALTFAKLFRECRERERNNPIAIPEPSRPTNLTVLR
jgi:thioesterase domain-containing protein